uniref:Nitric oxide synthase-interacting protein n=1 Tax=Knipowitschia caucasica TaxID=637954 RepID=A0AAV2M5H5_KNICA
MINTCLRNSSHTMTRHGKNCTAGAVYTYHEKRKDTAASGYGTQSVRLGKDAIKDFDCCCLSLQPCTDPVVTPEGYLYDKQAILEYILHQKTQISKQMKAYEKQKQKLNKEEESSSKSQHNHKVEQFKTSESSIVSKPINPFSPRTEEGAVAAAVSVAGSSKSLPSFWVPSLTPEAKASPVVKPRKTVLCPMSGRPLRMDTLTPVRFTPLDPSLRREQLLGRQERYVCAVTRDALGNSVPCAVLRPSGAVVTQECVQRLIRKDMVDPTTGDQLKDSDIILLQRGGTGYAGSGVELKAKEARPVMQA